MPLEEFKNTSIEAVGTNTEATEAPTPEAVGTATAAESGPSSVGGKEIFLDEKGELHVPDSFWDDVNEEMSGEKLPIPGEEPEPAAPASVAAVYTPEELAEAFYSGKIDVTKLTPELMPYYQAMDAAARRQAGAAQVMQQMQAQQVPQVQPEQMQHVQQVQPQATQQEKVQQLMQVGKAVAAQYMLGIRPEEFDEFNATHNAALSVAIGEITRQAQAMQVQQIEAQRLQMEFANMYASYKQKEPELDFIAERYFPAWREGLTVKENAAVDEAIYSRDMNKIKGLMDRVVADYKKAKGGAVSANRAQQSRPQPPQVVGAGNVGDPPAGHLDFSALGEMSPDQQAAWLIKNKFVA